MEALDKILAWIKSIIIDWRIGIVGFIGFTTGLIITKDFDLVIGVAVTASMIIVDIIDKNYKSWHESRLNKKLQKTLADPKHQQQFFDNCSDDEMKILTKLYRSYPNGSSFPKENVAINCLVLQSAISQASNMGVTDHDYEGNMTVKFMYVLQPWAKNWLDHHKKRLKKNV